MSNVWVFESGCVDGVSVYSNPKMAYRMYESAYSSDRKIKSYSTFLKTLRENEMATFFDSDGTFEYRIHKRELNRDCI